MQFQRIIIMLPEIINWTHFLAPFRVRFDAACFRKQINFLFNSTHFIFQKIPHLANQSLMWPLQLEGTPFWNVVWKIWARTKLVLFLKFSIIRKVINFVNPLTKVPKFVSKILLRESYRLSIHLEILNCFTPN